MINCPKCGGYKLLAEVKDKRSTYWVDVNMVKTNDPLVFEQIDECVCFQCLCKIIIIQPSPDIIDVYFARRD